MWRAFQVALRCAPLAGTLTGLALAAPKQILETASYCFLTSRPAALAKFRLRPIFEPWPATWDLRFGP
jgi:hypothetical protein